MPTLLIVRLRPSSPTTGAAFSDALSGLNISAHDLTFGDSLQGVPLGSASGVFSSSTVGDDTVDVTNTAIIQHYVDVNSGPTLSRIPQAAATAVIVVSTPTGHHEYPTAESFDVQLQLERGGEPIANGHIDTNTTVVSVGGALPTDLDDYIAMAPSAYAAVPAAATGAGAQLDLAEDGTPPEFTALVGAVDAVLADDPADGQPLAQRGQLTPAQALHVATELVWNRVIFPPPPEPRPLAQMYTSPPDDPGVTEEDAENDRRKFEAELAAYYATHDARAMRLAGFVYTASAAMLCERLSAGEDLPGAGPAGATLFGARSALLQFPLLIGASDGTTLTRTSVLLTGSPASSALDPEFVVPAAYFYALAAMLPPQVDTAQRYSMALADAETKLLQTMQAAVEDGVVGGRTRPPLAGTCTSWFPARPPGSRSARTAMSCQPRNG